MARILQPEQTGEYFLAISLAMIFSVIADSGITPVIIREIAQSPERTVSLFQRALTIKIPFLLLGYIFAVGSAFFLNYPSEIIFFTAIAALSLTLDSLHLFFYGVLRAHQRLDVEAVGMCSGQVIVACIGGIILWISPSIALLLLTLVSGSAFNIFLSGSTLIKQFGKKIYVLSWDYPSVKSLITMAFPFALAAIFVKVYSYIDTIFLSKFLDTTAVGYYSIAYKFTYAFQFIPLAFIAGLYPKFSWSLQHKQQELPGLFRKSLWYMFLVATPLVLGIWLIAEPVVLLLGESYGQAAPILSVLIFVLIPLFLDFPIGALLNASGRQSIKTVIMGLTMFVNVILNAFLIPTYQVFGAAYAALISFSVLFLCGFMFVPRIIPDFSFHGFFLDVFKISLAGLALVLTGILSIPLIGWIPAIPLCGIVYGVVLWLVKAVSFEEMKKTLKGLTK